MNGISGIGGGMGMPPMHGMRRPDPEEAAQQLFAQLDTTGQGYIEKSDLENAFERVSSVTSASQTSSEESDIDDLFAQLDTDGDGKITEQEFTDSLAEIDEQINSLFSQMQMRESMGSMMPPPPPPPEDDVGFTKEELMAQLEEIGDSDSERASLLETIIANFDEADTDGDGRVNFEEAMAYDQANSESETTSTDTTAGTSASDVELSTSEKVMLQIMRLLQAYGPGGGAEEETSSTLNVSA